MLPIDQILLGDCIESLRQLPSESVDLIFADPPYHRPQFSTIRRVMGLLKPGGSMLLSHPGSSEVLTQNGIVVVDNRSYGNAHLTRFRRE